METQSEEYFSKNVLSGMVGVFIQKGKITSHDAFQVLKACATNHLVRNKYHRYLRSALYALRELHSREPIQLEGIAQATYSKGVAGGQIRPDRPQPQPHGRNLLM